MKILVTSLGYPTKSTIDFVFVDQLCRALADYGINVTIIAPQSLGKILFRGYPRTIFKQEIVTIKSNRMTLYRPYYVSFGNVKYLKKINDIFFNFSVNWTANRLKINPDVCYGHFWAAVYSLSHYARKKSIPLIASSGEEEVTFHKKLSPSKKSQFLKSICGVISVSSKNRLECIDAGLATYENSIVIPNSIDSGLFYQRDKTVVRKKYGFSKDDFIVAFVGQLIDRKGVRILSKSLERLCDSSVKAFFIGSGPIDPSYSNILHKGMISHDLLPEYLSCADVFVLPTLNEGCSNAIIEAMACGLPIISSDRPFNYDILSSDNSILIDPENSKEIANAIRRLKDDVGLREKLASGSLLKAQELSLDQRVKKIISFIESRINNVKR